MTSLDALLAMVEMPIAFRSSVKRKHLGGGIMHNVLEGRPERLSQEEAISTGKTRSRASGSRWPSRARSVLLLWLVAFALSSAQSQTLKVLHNFAGAPGDGRNPESGLIADSSGNLFGTTKFGGSSNLGTVFKLDTSGTLTVLHSFTSSEGTVPQAGLIMDSSANLYGTTTASGPSSRGTLYKLDTSGTLSLLHSFPGGANDGAAPDADLITDSSGNLYGTTSVGGPSNLGTIFKLNTSGTLTVLHSFVGAPNDGTYPLAGLIADSSGNLYGTTEEGGASDRGTVFKLDTFGTLTVLHSFTGGAGDGALPLAGLIADSSGNLYGTTGQGGTSNRGTVFKLDTSGTLTLLHSFVGGPNDGSIPMAGLIADPSGNLYGTTELGGPSDAGTVFKVNGSGTLTVLHNFAVTDGRYPAAGLIADSSGNLYGTTLAGGSSGNGTVFELVLSIPFSVFTTKLGISSGPPPGFDLNGQFALGSGSAAINPATQALTLQVGTYQVTLPAGSFRAGPHGTFVFEGTVTGVTLQIRISPAFAGSYQIQVEASGVDLTGLTNPVTVTLAIGNNNGTTQVTSGF
jgi:uncharacterized repeat protein (TIGR03803 family)